MYYTVPQQPAPQPQQQPSGINGFVGDAFSVNLIPTLPAILIGGLLGVFIGYKLGKGVRGVTCAVEKVGERRKARKDEQAKQAKKLEREIDKLQKQLEKARS